MYASWRRMRRALSAARPESFRIDGGASIEERKSQSEICCCSYCWARSECTVEGFVADGPPLGTGMVLIRESCGFAEVSMLTPA